MNSPEQQHGPEEELQTSPELKSKVEQGQQLAEQIQGMRERAQTKEDYVELQKKLAELRKVFEAETEALDDGYRDFDEVVSQVYFTLVDSLGVDAVTSVTDWPWSVSTGTEGNMIVDMGYLTSVDQSFDEDQYKFEKPTPEVISTLKRDNLVNTEGQSFANLKSRIKHKKVKSYITLDGQWALELEPDLLGYRDFQEVYDDVISNFGPRKVRFKAKMFQEEGDKQTFIDMHTHFEGTDYTDRMDFNDVHPSHLVDIESKTMKILNNYEADPDTLKTDLAHRKVKSYNIDGFWILEVEPGPPIYPLSKSIVETVKFLDRSSIILDENFVYWAIDGDHKYVDMGCDLSGLKEDSEYYIKNASQNQSTEILNGNDMSTGIGIDELRKELGGELLVRPINYDNRLFLEIMEKK